MSILIGLSKGESEYSSKIPNPSVLRFIQVYLNDDPYLYLGALNNKDHQLLHSLLGKLNLKSDYRTKRNLETVPEERGESYKLVGSGQLTRPFNNGSRVVFSEEKRTTYKKGIDSYHLGLFLNNFVEEGLEVEVKEP